jgi:hypothetical protein
MEFDQEKTLDLATKVIKEQAFHLSKAIENNNLRLALKESSIMLAELKSGSLSPKNYYILFSSLENNLLWHFCIKIFYIYYLLFKLLR